jgi:hypothetical protein
MREEAPSRQGQAQSSGVQGAVTSTESSDVRTIHYGVLQEKLLVSDRTIAPTSPYATGSCFDNGVGQVILSLRPGASVIIHMIHVISGHTESG